MQDREKSFFLHSDVMFIFATEETPRESLAVKAMLYSITIETDFTISIEYKGANIVPNFV